MNIIAILNQKGGVGKTTTAINLGAYLAKSGKNVLIVDFDPQGNATGGLGIDKSVQPSMYDVVMGSVGLDQAVRSTNVANVRLVPSNPSLAAAEVDMVDKPNRELLLKDALSMVDADFVLIDCPPSLGLLTINALSAADLVLIPVQAEYYALEGLGQLMDTIQQVRNGGLNPQLELIGIVLTMHDSRTSLSDQVHDQLKTHFGDKVFKTFIPRNVRLAEAPSHGKTIMEHDKWSKGARAYKQLAKEVLSRVNN